MFTLLDESSNFSGPSSTNAQVSSMSANGDSLNVLVRRDLAALRVFNRKPANATEKHEDSGDSDERCAGCEAAVQTAIDVGIADDLPAHLERGFRQHLVRVLRRRSRLEESMARRGAVGEKLPPTKTPHIFLIHPNVVQSSIIAKQLRVHGIRSGKVDRDDRGLFRLVQSRPMMVLLQNSVDARPKIGSVSVLSVQRPSVRKARLLE